LITGAAGSIGSEIARQCLELKPAILLLLDQAETPLHNLELELRLHKNFSITNVEFIIGDIGNYGRMELIFSKFKPDIVYHAAAYKHVPMMESNPAEAVSVNVLGTKIIADLSIIFKTKKFVMVSTDKAVNPTNIMGTSKRIAEIYTQALQQNQDYTKFVITRFGNVLGSNGSVIPLFKKQIEEGGPITVTHRDITRYFMTIPEACQLVLEAGTMGLGGEIFVFDMGQSVKVYDIALKMIKLSGLQFQKDIDIKIIGLRPGEKLYEELLNNKENTIPTHHPKIMIGKVNAYPFTLINSQVNELKETLKLNDNFKLVALMKKIVPEFISQNSVFSEIDKK
jgi:FlaA1/EpsC-like NDP-sugar epimerase